MTEHQWARIINAIGSAADDLATNEVNIIKEALK